METDKVQYPICILGSRIELLTSWGGMLAEHPTAAIKGSTAILIISLGEQGISCGSQNLDPVIHISRSCELNFMEVEERENSRMTIHSQSHKLLHRVVPE